MSRIEAILGRLRVRDIMTPDVKVVTPDMTVEEFVQFVFRNKHLGYPVVEDGRLVGIITLHDVTGRRSDERIGDLMSRDVIVLSPDDPATEAFRIMNETGVGRIPVVEDGRVVGIVSKTDLVRLMQIQEVLRVG
ncbi:MAG: CBS domain-containing protein [Archaeoglobi archaeon]|nr:CBS domain-containing protein [Archaeoglobi archaeon]